MSHKDEAPHKVEAIKKHLRRAFENPQLQVRHFFEADRSLQSFRLRTLIAVSYLSARTTSLISPTMKIV